MQLESFASGAESAKLAKKNSSNLVPKSNEEYLYFRFKITYHSGTQTIKAKDVFNYYYNIFGANSTKQMTNLDWGFFFEDVDDLGTLGLQQQDNQDNKKASLISRLAFLILNFQKNAAMCRNCCLLICLDFFSCP